MYMLAGLLCALSLRCALRWLDSEQDDGRPPDLAALAGSALAALGALYTLFIAGAALLALNLVVLLAWLAGGPDDDSAWRCAGQRRSSASSACWRPG